LSVSAPIQRVILVLVAVAAIAWLAVSLSDERALNRAIAAPKADRPARATLESALRDAKRASRLRPGDQAPDLAQAKLLTGLGRQKEALALLDRVRREEPENVQVWFSLYLLAPYVDPARADEARRWIRQLDPVSSRGFR
jgi:predicted Zn-dependent protease